VLFCRAGVFPLVLLLLASCGGFEHRNGAAVTTWPMYQFRPDHNAYIARDDFSAQWTYDAGARINGGLALAGNTLIFGTFSNQVVALDIRNGTLVWKASADNIVMSTPIVYNNLVYVGTGANGSLFGQRRGAQRRRCGCRRSWSRVVEIPTLRVMRSNAYDAAIGVMRQPSLSAKSHRQRSYRNGSFARCSSRPLSPALSRNGSSVST